MTWTREQLEALAKEIQAEYIEQMSYVQAEIQASETQETEQQFIQNYAKAS